jgi:hypothetical protein
MDDTQLPLTDALIMVGARPGESWEQARNRLERLRFKERNQGALTLQETERLIDLITQIQTVYFDALPVCSRVVIKQLLAQLLNLSEYCYALSEGRDIQLQFKTRLYAGELFDEVYVLISRMSPQNADSVVEEFGGLIDILSDDNPSEALQYLREEGLLKMVLGR